MSNNAFICKKCDRYKNIPYGYDNCFECEQLMRQTYKTPYDEAVSIYKTKSSLEHIKNCEHCKKQVYGLNKLKGKRWSSYLGLNVND